MYGIVKQSGGYIWVYSEPGKGTSFKVYLPHVTEAGEMVAEPVPQPSLSLRGQPLETILVVEDEANLRRLTRQFLENRGYTVLEAADGAAAVQICVAHQGTIHLLLTDVIMPGMNGRELANRVAEIRPNMKVLYMSGYTENAIGHNGTLDAGIKLLQKPFTLQALQAKVREVLDQKPPPGGRNVSSSSTSSRKSAGPATNSLLFAHNASISSCRCDIANWANKAGGTERRRTSVVPACSFKRKKSCSPTCNWKSTWSCRQKLPDSVPLKSSAAEKWFAPSSPARQR